jgi:hypothetical protein
MMDESTPQMNRYALYGPTGESAGFIVEEGSSIMNMVKRQLFRTRRPFSALVLDAAGAPVLRVSRPFYWLNSHITVTDLESDTEIGEVHSDWHLWRRRFDLFEDRTQFARVDGGFLAVDFIAQDEAGVPLSVVQKNWTGLASEIFTDARRVRA